MCLRSIGILSPKSITCVCDLIIMVVVYCWIYMLCFLYFVDWHLRMYRLGKLLQCWTSMFYFILAQKMAQTFVARLLRWAENSSSLTWLDTNTFEIFIYLFIILLFILTAKVLLSLREKTLNNPQLKNL